MSKARVVLERCPSLNDAGKALPLMLEEASLWGGRNLHCLRVLVKPNLLRAVPLACTSPAVVAAVCVWLKACGASVAVADSPGFGTALGVAKRIGLDEALRPLGLAVQRLVPGKPVRLPSGNSLVLAKQAQEADAILSVGRVKVHSQMLLTLACKNLYGLVPGLRKALCHSREGQDPDAFADMLASLMDFLPPVSAVLDGVEAMHVTGPAGGRPYALGLLGAGASPVALDEAVCLALGKRPEDVPLQRAFIRRRHPDCSACGCEAEYPRLRPEDFSTEGFVFPSRLQHTSFRPMRLLKSCLKRLWMDRFA
ncbi:MAG: DUF362 domain-containing protein [Desulfovibrio sp.]|nr:DUF362 domain-containing protein [Desulfovibrio sp.]